MSPSIDLPLGFTPLALAASITVYTVGSFIRTGERASSDRGSDGFLARHAANLGAAIGLSSALISPSVNRELYHFLDGSFSILWALLALQAIILYVEAGVTKRFKYGILGAASSGLVLLSITYSAVYLQLDIRDVPWLQLLAAGLYLCACLSLPRRPQASIDGERFDKEHGVSIISLLFFSWASFPPTEPSVHDLPKVSVDRRTKTVRSNFHLDAGNGALWYRLVRAHRWHLLFQSVLVFIKGASQLATRFALLQLLLRLEGSSSTLLEKWLCVAGLGLGLIADGVASGWLTWFTQMWMSSTTTSLLKSLLFDKSTRLPLRYEDPTPTASGVIAIPATASPTGKTESHLSLADLMDNDSVAVSSSFSSWHPFVLVLFKVLFDMTYLANLIGLKGIAIGGTVSLIVLPLSTGYSKRHGQAQQDLAKVHAALFGIIAETSPALHQIRFASMERAWETRILAARSRQLAQRWKAGVAQINLTLASNLGRVILSTVALSVYSYDTGNLTPSIAFAALSLFDNLHAVVRELPVMSSNLNQSWISCERIQRYLDLRERRPAAVLGEHVRFKNASAAWPVQSNGPARNMDFYLRDISLNFPNRELSIITGKTGSGKSLLVTALLDEARLLGGTFYKPGVTEAGQNNAAERAINTPVTAVVTQPPWIDDCTIRENILFGSDFRENRYRNVLMSSALQQDVNSLPEGDMTRAGRNGSMLSGGQKWRIALARALYSSADIIILEDILSAVDTHVAAWIYENALLGELAEGRTRILVTHRPEMCHGLIKYTVTVQDHTARGAYQFGSHNLHDASAISSPAESPSHTPAATKDGSTKRAPARKIIRKDALSLDEIFLLYFGAGGGFIAIFVGGLITLACRLSSSANTWWLAKWTKQQNDRDLMTYNISMYILLSLGDGFVIAIQSAVFLSISIRASRVLFKKAIHSSLHASLALMDSIQLGNGLRALGDQMYWIDHRVSTELNGLLRTSTQLLFIIWTSLVSGPYTGYFSPILIGGFVLTFSKYINRSKKLVRLIPDVLRPILSLATSTEEGLPTIRAFGKIPMYIDRMDDLLDVDLRLSRQLALCQRWFHLRMGLFGAAFVIVTAGALVHNKLDAATAGFTLGLALQMKSTLSGIAGKLGTLQRAGSAVERVLDLGYIDAEPQDGTEPPADWPSRGSVAVRDLELSYGPTLPLALDEISFTVNSCQRLGIVGRTGSGKTTLMNALLRFFDCCGGNIEIDGIEARTMKLASLRRAIAIIPQDPFLFSGTLRENLDADGGKSDEELQCALRRVHFSVGRSKDFESESDGELPSLDMPIGVGGRNISYGQRQLVCLARALLSGCRIVILDEATSALDDATDTAIQQVLRREFRDATVLAIAHKLSAVADFDSILVLDSGRVSEFGSPAELMEQKGMFYDMVEQSGDIEKIKAIIEA